MRKDEIIKKIEEISLDKPDLKKTESLILDILKFFEYIREKLESPDEKDREAALQEIQEVQKRLDALAQSALTQTGMSPQQIVEFIANPKNFAPTDWTKINQIRGDINSYGSHVKNTMVKP